MAAIDSPVTLSELQASLAYATKENPVTMATVLGQYLNRGLRDMHAEPWSWAERRAVLLTHPGYTTGTASISLSTRTTVTGTGTAWDTLVTGMTFANTRAGGKLVFQGESEVYTVASTDAPTQITLVERYMGTAALTTVVYRYYEDEYTLPTDFDDLTNAQFFSEPHGIRLIGPTEFERQFGGNVRQQRPTHATVKPVNPAASATERRQIVLAPAPDRMYQIPYRYQTNLLAISAAGVTQIGLVAATDQPIVPMRYRMGIVHKAAQLWAMERQRNPDLATIMKGQYDELMLRARQNIATTDDRPRLVPRIRYQHRARYPRVAGLRGFAGERWDQLQD